MSIVLPDFTTTNVLVVGDIMLDRYWHGPTKRISPEAPVPVVRVNDLEERPGGAANVAVNIAALGAKTLLLGYTGDDEAANTLGQKLTSLGVAHHFSRHADLPTITKLRVMSRNQQLIRLDFEQDFSKVNTELLHRQFQKALSDHDIVILSDYAKGALQDVQKLIAYANQENVPVIVDPKGTDFERYRNATLITPNLSEFEAVVGECSSQEELIEKATVLMTSLNLKALLVTQGEHGMTLVQHDQAAIHLESQAREVFDVTGAGDTVIATLAAAIGAKASLSTAAELANIAAGIVVAKAGTAIASREEISYAIAQKSAVKMGVMSEAELVTLCEEARLRGERIVMTNGCFDILHAGHVEYLQQARALGDRLIIAVNDDASVSRLKGPTRPINSLPERMALLAALRAVDWVVPFVEDTPARLISAISPDILVKGGDYTVEQIAGAPHVLARGGEVKIMPLKPGCSTTNIVGKIQNQAEVVES
jgi:D-beta-D-heptose 7-phosphate kinase/D-beta-D-heptose 1-phosphate adenosyltransferase